MTSILPSKEAIEVASEKLAQAYEKSGLPGNAAQYRSGSFADSPSTIALAIALQEMSDAVKAYWAGLCIPERFAQFILPEPVDPLVEAIGSVPYLATATQYAEHIRTALAKRGLQIVPIKETS